MQCIRRLAEILFHAPYLHTHVSRSPAIWSRLYVYLVPSSLGVLSGTVKGSHVCLCTPPEPLEPITNSMRERLRISLWKHHRVVIDLFASGFTARDERDFKKLLRELSDGGHRWCRCCRIVRPPRASHCSDCHNCVLR